MDKQPNKNPKVDGLVTYSSTSRQLSPTLLISGNISEPNITWHKNMGMKKILHFRDHIFRTKNARVIKACNDKIKEWKDSGQIPFFMSLDEAELMKARIQERVAVMDEDGKAVMVDMKTIEEALKLYDRKSDVKAGLIGTVAPNLKGEFPLKDISEPLKPEIK